jgi:hypothetical protein
MKRNLIDQKQMQNKTNDLTYGSSEQRNCEKRSHRRKKRMNEALELMRGIGRAPLGEFPERDERIKAAWHSSAE